MSNRRKQKDNKLRLKRDRTKLGASGLAKKLFSTPSNREDVPTADEIFGNRDLFSVLDSPLARAIQAEHPDSILTEEALIKLGVTKEYPTEEPQLIRVVPAKADGIVVGQALIYDDGSIGYRQDPNADPEGLKRVHETEQEVGYSLQEGRPFAIGEAGGPDGPPQED